MFRRLQQFLLMGLLSMTVGVAQAASPERVVALGGDVTEAVYLLQAADRLVGVDATSVWPAEARQLPNVGYVRQIAAEGVLSLRPELVLATHDAGPPPALDQLRAAGVTVIQFEQTRDAAGIAQKLRGIGEALGLKDDAETLADKVEAQALALQQQVEAMTHHPRVVFVMSGRGGGLMAAGRGTAADAMLALSGADNVVSAFEGYKPLAPEQLVALAPEVLIMMDEQQGAPGSVDAVLAQPGVAQTPAGEAGRVWTVDGQALLGFGPRALEHALQLQQRLGALSAP